MEKREDGSILMIAVVILLLAIPAVYSLIHVLQVQLRQANMEKKFFAAQDLPQNGLTDYMRQFAQNTSINWSNLDQFKRPDAFYAAGFSTMTFVADTANRLLRISATGTFDPLNTGKGTKKSMKAVLGFKSDSLSFASINNNMSVSGNGLTLGSVYTLGNISVTGLNNVFGKIMAGGNINLDLSTAINGDIYLGGTYAGPPPGSLKFPGNLFPYTIPVILPVTDLTYWLTQSNVNPWASPVATITFRNPSGNGWVHIEDGFGDNDYRTDGPGGLVILVDGAAHLIGNNQSSSIDGKVRGHVTLVASTITIQNSVVYANGSNWSSAEDSLALMSWNTIQLIKNDVSVDTMVVTAVMWPNYKGSTACSMLVGSPILNGASGRVCRWLNVGPGGNSAARLDIFGTTRSGLNRVCDNWKGNTHTCLGSVTNCALKVPLPIFEWEDPNLSKFPPPGFPERCTILSYEESGK